MIISPFTSVLLSPLLSDDKAAEIFSDAAMTNAMLRAEAALARAAARCGLVPPAEAEKITAAAERLKTDMAALGAAAAANGPPVMELVRQLKAAADSPHVHTGATSQDIVDSAFVLQLRAFLDLADARLRAVCARLADMAQQHAAMVMAARTRTQQAVPTTFGLKAANWLLPLVRQRQRLHALRPQLLVAQLGGAAGTLAMGAPAAENNGAIALARAYADELQLDAPPLPWHQQRDTPAALAAWLAITSGALAKIGGDVMLLAQNEVAEVLIEDGGQSSAMPHKSNPVAAETISALSTFSASQLPAAIAAMRHMHERGGDAWQTEWLVLPAMAVATAAALRHTDELLARLKPQPQRMRENIAGAGDAALAAGIAAALSPHMAADEAATLVREALRQAQRDGRRLTELLSEKCEAPVDWHMLQDAANHVGAAHQLVAQALALWRDSDETR